MTKIPTKFQKASNKKFSTDDGTWDRVAASVKPLRSSLKNRVLDKEAWLIHKKFHEKKTEFLELATVRSNKIPWPSLPELRHGSQNGLDKSNAKKLKKGQHTIEGKLDLHGMTQDKAHNALDYFIEASYRSGKRCVLIITGKGMKIDGSFGVLRTVVPRWLNEVPIRSRVLAFSYATPKHGGEGALYVMLKKKR